MVPTPAIRTWLPLRVGVGYVGLAFSVAGSCRATVPCPATFCCDAGNKCCRRGPGNSGPNSVHETRLRAARPSARGAKICFLAQVSAQVAR